MYKDALRFDLQKYWDIGFAMHCPTRESASIFLKFLHENGREWCNGESYIIDDGYALYGDETCYLFNKGTISNIQYLLKTPGRYSILNFHDFCWEVEDIIGDYSRSELLEDFLSNFRTVT